jgi:hypothetical protein
MVAISSMMLIPACMRGPNVERARGQGGSVIRQVRTTVYAGFPGTWRFRMTLLAPDTYAWTIYTSGQPDHYVFDGTTARTFVNGQEVAAEVAAAAPLRSHARFMAVATLDALAAPGVVSAPDGDRLRITFPDGAAYRVGLDRAGRVVTASGPLDLSPFANEDVTATFDDHRDVGGRMVPFKVHYELRGTPLADETLLSACVDDPRVTSAAFTRPDLIPECMP